MLIKLSETVNTYIQTDNIISVDFNHATQRYQLEKEDDVVFCSDYYLTIRYLGTEHPVKVYLGSNNLDPRSQEWKKYHQEMSDKFNKMCNEIIVSGVGNNYKGLGFV